ncbi:bifunctional aspartate kinase/homoserine dehydrogenase I [Buchnera aphidicola]|uniref:bifunctional aspartate kinase/homoserine dehydrogenase I n=1 Tax=Buchnera aphidicola TaxID=9 RepID=UPI003464E1C5
MRTLKFGGTSLSNSQKFLEVSDIIIQKIKKEEISVVLSAPAKVTNILEEIAQSVKFDNDINNLLNNLKEIFYTLICEIKNKQSNFIDRNILKKIDKKLSEIQKIKKNINSFKINFKTIYANIISFGEMFSIKTMEYILMAKKYNVTVINPVKNILAMGDITNSIVDINASKDMIQKLKIPKNHIILMPGFIAGNKNKELVLLGRNGSDYSAAILSVCLRSKICEIWTDVDGIYTSDPRIVPSAKLLPSISYQEAMELSTLGAKVLHPKTIFPLSQFKIKCIIKNTLNPQHDGTTIENQINDKNKQSIKGITYLDNIEIITIKINKTIHIYEIINKLISILNQEKINIIFTIKSLDDHKIHIYIIDNKNIIIKNILSKKFEIEIQKKILKSINILNKIKIISIIGNNIKNNRKIHTKICFALEHTDLKIINFTQQLSNNSISFITNNKNINNNIHKIHEILFNNEKIIELFIIGIGGVGTALIKQIIKQQEKLQSKNIKIIICGIANSKNMIINPLGIKLKNEKIHLTSNNETFCINQIIQIAKNHNFINPVIVDCTSSKEISNLYPNILSNGIHVVTPNKKGNTTSWKEYNHIRKIAIRTNKKFLYETNVSAGLPIIETLKNLLDSGDQLIRFRGILSGSLSFIFGKLEEGMLLSQATNMAKKLGFTEPNPKDDLSGIDVARKLLIIAREAGYKLELENIKIQPILSKELLNIKEPEIFLSKLKKLDQEFLYKIKKAQKKNKVLRLIGTIDEEKNCKVELKEIDITDPLYNVKNGENALTIYSKYYQPIPLVLRGYGAGNDVTAAGIFSDLLRILS